ncbi:methionine ABC transporter permease [Fusobacterium sp. PH5-44]|uniref:methionine ABC transporter permease n=1 Tax=unclassified Fusobacterium TaxID=2648384 RepID=UPI003D1A81EA
MELSKILDLTKISLGQTLFMVFFSTIFATIIGFPIGILLVTTKKDGISEMPTLNKILGIFVNVFRSIPFVILMVYLMPITKKIVGTTIGNTAAIVPLSLSAAPFVARLIEGALGEVDKGLIEASESMGASNWSIVKKVMIPEAMPQIIHGIIMTIISLIGFSAIAGVIGAGGLGDLAIRYGYQRNMPDVRLAAVVVIVLLVQGIQMLGNILVRASKKNR